jgi:hypothetical protein
VKDAAAVQDEMQQTLPLLVENWMLPTVTIVGSDIMFTWNWQITGNVVVQTGLHSAGRIWSTFHLDSVVNPSAGFQAASLLQDSNGKLHACNGQLDSLDSATVVDCHMPMMQQHLMIPIHKRYGCKAHSSHVLSCWV